VLFIGAITLLDWCRCVQAIGPMHVGAWLVWLLTSVLSVRHWAQGPAAYLTWQDPDWIWCAAEGQATGLLGGPRAVIDLPDALLLRLCKAQGGVLYIWADRHTAPACWLPLRRAVFGRRGAQDFGQYAQSVPNPPLTKP